MSSSTSDSKLVCYPLHSPHKNSLLACCVYSDVLLPATFFGQAHCISLKLVTVLASNVSVVLLHDWKLFWAWSFI